MIENITHKIIDKANTDAIHKIKRKMVFTNGVFDILHSGHLSYLARAKDLVGDSGSLVIGLNSDISTKMLGKGNHINERPINKQADRKLMLACLYMVDYVIIFEEKTPLDLMHILRPDIYVKAGDYTLENLPEVPLMNSFGGQSIIMPFIEGYSSTSIINKIKNDKLKI
jgi:D-glycero-beta-D-manno-heptose 1-phosphate adenylyltransferase